MMKLLKKVNFRKVLEYQLLFLPKFAFIIVFLIILIPLIGSDSNGNGSGSTVSYTSTTTTSCTPIIEEEEVCFTDYCVDYETHTDEEMEELGLDEEDRVYCSDMRDTYCRTNQITSQQCTSALYSGAMYHQNSSGDWVDVVDVFRITKNSDDLTFHYDGIKGNFDITFETGVIYNNNYYSMYDVKQLKPEIQFNFPTQRYKTYRKYAVNITNVILNKSKLDFITLTYKSHNGFNLSQLKKSGRKYFVKGIMQLGFNDLLENDFNISINKNEKRVYIGNISDKFVGDNLYLDPTVKIWANESNAFNFDTYITDADEYTHYTGSYVEIQAHDGVNSYGILAFNKTAIPIYSVYYDAELCMFSGSNTLDINEGYNISVHHIYYEFYKNLGWYETINWDERPGVNDYSAMYDSNNFTSGQNENQWVCWNVTEILQNESNYGTFQLKTVSMVSFYLLPHDLYGTPNSEEYVRLYSEDYFDEKPYLNVSYSANLSNIQISKCFVLNGEGGQYFLTANITDSTTSNCMDIIANNVTLDCQGHTIDGDNSADYGIRVNGYSNISIKNCTLTDWDTYTILLSSANLVNLTDIIMDGTYSNYVLHSEDSNSTILKNVNITTSLNTGFYLQDGSLVKIYNSSIKNSTYWDFYPTTPYSDLEIINLVGTGGKQIVYYNSSVSIRGWNNNVTEIILANADSSSIENVTITGNQNNVGIWVWGVSNLSVVNSTFTNLYEGFWVYRSHNLTFENSTFDSNEFIGLYLLQTNSSNVTNSRFTNNSEGIRLHSAANNYIYNNFFNNTDYNVEFGSGGIEYINYWNTSKRLGTNIYDSNNPYIGGNYWTNSSGDGYSDTCTDANGDGFCDTAYNVSSGLVSVGGTDNNIDYLPLSDEYDIIPPNYTNIITKGTNKTATIVTFNTTWNDNASGLNGWLFEHNQTGTYTNQTFNTTWGANYESTFNLLITLTRHQFFYWKFYANDTNSNMNDSMPYQLFNVTNTAPTMTSAELNKTATVLDTDDLNCSAVGKADVDSDTTTYHYEWYNNTVVQGIDNVKLGNSNLTSGDDWYCEAWVRDGFENSSKYTSSTVTIGSSEVAPSITTANATTENTGINSTATNPTNNNSWLNMSILFTDADADAWTAYFCTTPTWGDCQANASGEILCKSQSNLTTKTLTCIYNVSGYTGTNPLTWYAFVLDNTSKQSTSTSATFEVNYPPSIPTLVYPPIDSYFNINYTFINFTATEPDSGDTINYTLYINESTSFNFIYNGTNKYYNYSIPTEFFTYNWRVYTHDQHNYGYHNVTLGNFTSDYTKPNATITSPSDGAALTSRTFTFQHTAEDNYLSNCSLRIYQTALGYGSPETGYDNLTINCSVDKSVTVTATVADYTLYLYAYDKASNLNATSITFSTSLPSPGAPPGGGGGAVAPEIIIELTCETDEDCKKYGETYVCVQGFCLEFLPVCNFDGVCSPELGENIFNCGDEYVNGTLIIEGDCHFVPRDIIKMAVSSQNILWVLLILFVVLIIVLNAIKEDSFIKKQYKRAGGGLKKLKKYLRR